jgi:hypothetical protein
MKQNVRGETDCDASIDEKRLHSLLFLHNLYNINLYRKGKPAVRRGRKVMDLSIRCVLIGRPPGRRSFLFGGLFMVLKEVLRSR